MTSPSSTAPSSPLAAIDVPLGPSAVRDSIIRRLLRLRELELHPAARAIELEMCRRDRLHWFHWWAWTFDPRAAAEGGQAHVPLDLFPRQVDMVRWIEARLAARDDGALAKSRDVGFTWVAGGFAWHAWRFVDGFKTTFGSRKGEYVDRIGDPDSIFEKIRMIQRALPWWMLPPGFQAMKHDNHMLILNPANENTIRGEGGDEMGRGGRSTLYFIDEAAFIERAERVDASTSANTDVRIWGSSVNGMGNLFATKWHGGTLRPEQLFRFHYTDDPRKTPEWAARKRASMEPHLWASEYDIDFTASVEGICIPAKWVEAAKGIRVLLAQHGIVMEPAVRGEVGGDIGAGKAKSVAVPRFGPVVLTPTSWLDPDTIETAERMLDVCKTSRLTRADKYECTVKTLRWDNVGVGHGVGATLKRSSKGIMSVGVNVGQPPSTRRWPDGETSVEKFGNMKAEAWWTCRDRFKCTYEMTLHLTGQEGGIRHPPDELISLPPDSAGPDAMALAGQLSLVRYGRNEKGKIVIETKDALAKRGIASPDHAEALILTYTSPSAAESLRRAAAA